MDRIGADFHRTVDMIRDRLDAAPAVIQLPIGVEGGFCGIVDLLAMEALIWDDDMGEKWRTESIPAEMQHEAEEARHLLVDVLSTHDDTIMEKYVAEEDHHRRRPPQGAAGGHDQERGRARALRVGVQEQGRPADARRGRGPPPEPARRRPHQGSRPEGRTRSSASPTTPSRSRRSPSRS